MVIFNQLDTKESSFSRSFNAYLVERNKVSDEISQLVSEIILKIRSKGDNALRDLTKEFDGFDPDVFKISNEEISSISFFSLFKTPSTFVIRSNLLDFKDFATAPAAVSPFILYV